MDNWHWAIVPRDTLLQTLSQHLDNVISDNVLAHCIHGTLKQISPEIENQLFNRHPTLDTHCLVCYSLVNMPEAAYQVLHAQINGDRIKQNIKILFYTTLEQSLSVGRS